MKKLLVNLLGDVPVLGMSLKIAYISHKALEVVNSIKTDGIKSGLVGDELENYISDLSNESFEEHLKPEIDKLGLPDFATNKASEKAIEIMSKKLKEKYLSQTN